MIEFLWPYASLFLPLPILVYLLAPKAEYKEPALQVPFFAAALLVAVIFCKHDI